MFSMEWVIFAVIAGLASNAFNFVNRHALRKDEDSSAYAWWFELIRVVVFSVLVFFSFSLVWEWTSLLWLILLGLTEFFSVYLFMKMHALTELSTSSIIIRLRLVWLPIMAMIFLRERLTTLEYLGIIIIFLGLVITSSPKKIKVDKGIKTALAFSMVNALLTVFLKKTAQVASTSIVMVAAGLPSVFILPVLMKKPVKRIKQAMKTTLSKNILASFFNVIAMYFLIMAYRVSPASKATGVYQSMLIFSVFGGIIFLKETKDIKKKIIGSIVTMIGVLLITGIS